MTDPDLLTHLTALEQSLLDPSVRANQPLLESLLTDDFREFGSSGKIYTRQEILTALAQQSPQVLSAREFNLHVLSSHAALLTYKAQSQSGTTLRSSLWVQRDGTWQILFHQGTPAA